ncbi:MAG: penicillin-binding protein 2 [Bacteroidales bacterium]|nr:penicillin-binding protein 2 [Bacteroidales bacterium]MBS3773758.1 penicillin-binding protein 2 [Bacteroidales bacterium]
MDTYAIRRNIIGVIVVITALIFLVRLFFIQAVDQSYQLSADNNVVRQITQYPARGLIYDRNGELLVYNQAAYDIMVTPQHLEAFDTTEFCNILDIDRAYLIKKLKEAKDYSNFKPSVFLKLVSSETYAKLQEQLYKFPGFFVQPRTLRRYNYEGAAHLLGYIGEVSDRLVDTNDYYKSGDYVGVSGIEESYEEALRGQKGMKVYLVDVHNRIKGSYRDGMFDQEAEAGSDLTTTVDMELQQYGEKLMHNKVGSIVAIEPKTGEILASISTPSYDPGLLVGRQRSKNFKKLDSDTLNPLFNRALMARYPPGSTFKVVNALIGQEEDVVNRGTTYECHGGFRVGNFFMGCHNHPSPQDLVGSIKVSCNAYYANVFKRILQDPEFDNVSSAFTNWKRYLESLGLGQKLNTDLPNEASGFLPSVNYYNRYYGENRWKYLNVISLAIGQGELGITTLQLANMTSLIANRGGYYTPHVIKQIEGEQTIDSRFREKHQSLIDSVNFEPVIEGMDLAVNGEPGTGSTARTASIEDITVCGKTGTAENPHGKDHSIFIAFAPKEDPKIALAVYIENGGFGATWAAPVAKLMIEKYLQREISVKWWEDYVLEANLLNPKEDDEEKD